MMFNPIILRRRASKGFQRIYYHPCLVIIMDKQFIVSFAEDTGNRFMAKKTDGQATFVAEVR
jgi:hypothetical protein